MKGSPVASDYENLFAIGMPEASATPIRDHADALDEPETPTPVPAPHPAAELQEAYEQSFQLYAQAFEGFAHADSVASTAGYSSRISSSAVDYDDMSRCAVRHTVQLFTDQMLGGGASLDAEEEFERANGKGLHDVLNPDRGRRRHRHDDDDEVDNVKVNLVALWDSMARIYDDGGVWLGRHQAAQVIMDKWRLKDQSFDIKNGKAVVEQRVYSEPASSYCPRRVHYNYIQDIHKLFKALDVFFDYAELPGHAMQLLWSMQKSRGNDLEVVSGASYMVVAGTVQVRTFNEQWKWTLRVSTAEKLREFLAAYYAPKT